MAAPIGRRKAAAAKSEPSPAPDPKHNQRPGDEAKAKYEAEKVQLLSFMHKFREADAEVQKKAAEAKIARDAKNEIARFAKAALGIARKDMDVLLAEMSASKRDLIREEQDRRRRRDMLGIVTEEQLDIFADGQPSEVTDEATARGEGYMAGMRCAARDCPTHFAGRFMQAWLAGYDDGAKVMNDAIEAAAKAEVDRRTAELEAAAKIKADEEVKLKAEEEAKKDPEDDIKADAKKLKESGWADKPKSPPSGNPGEIF